MYFIHKYSITCTEQHFQGMTSICTLTGRGEIFPPMGVKLLSVSKDSDGKKTHIVDWPRETA